jgi:hypothetical protein
MDDNHVKNSMCYLYRKILEYEARAPAGTNAVAARQNNLTYLGFVPEYYINKTIELAEEAQRRSILPTGDYTYPQMMTMIQAVNDPMMARRAATNPYRNAIPQAEVRRTNNPSTINFTQLVADAPPAVMSIYVDVLGEVKKQMAMPPPPPPVKVDRNLSFEL